MHFKYIILYISLIVPKFIFSNGIPDSTLINDEDNIRVMAQRIVDIRFNDPLKDSLNNILINTIEKALSKENSFYYPFDSIQPLTVIKSADEYLKIFTWSTINKKGEHTQFGFMQYYAKSKDKIYVYRLDDKSPEMADAHNMSLKPENWYGAIYYQIIEQKYQGTTLYTLLGWDGNNLHSNKKVIESLVFSESGRPSFGKTVFYFGKSKAKRVIYEYAQMANMMLQYDEKLKMIVMDHLAPSSDIYYGNFAKYGPDLSYDGLKYEKEYWEYLPTIDFKKQAEKTPFLQRLKPNRN